MTDHSIRRITRIAEALGARTYLEVGVSTGSTFNGLSIPLKDAVDPNFRFDVSAFENPSTRFFPLTSDDFFCGSDVKKTYDIIFLDGLHTFEQTFRDLCASLTHAHERTILILDDTLPSDIFSAHRDQARSLRMRKAHNGRGTAWHGDVYKVVFAVHDFMPTLSYLTINTGGNAQTFLWKKPRRAFKPLFDNLETISRLDYDAFKQHIAVLNGVDEDAGLAMILAKIDADAKERA